MRDSPRHWTDDDLRKLNEEIERERIMRRQAEERRRMEPPRSARGLANGCLISALLWAILLASVLWGTLT